MTIFDELKAERTVQQSNLALLEARGPDQFLLKAKRITREALAERHGKARADEADIYVVWFCKTLQNWKALLSSNMEDGLYFELTYDGDKMTTYVDTYSKLRNVAVPDTL